MTLADLQTLVDYHYWARDRLLQAVEPLTTEQYTRELGNSFSSIRDTLVHLYGAESVWYGRWEGESPDGLPTADTFPDLAALRDAWHAQEQRIRALVHRFGEDGVNRVIEYRMFDGRPSAQPFCHMLQHVVNHGSYHRGQVTTMLRQLKAAPPRATDLIAFYRERGTATV